MTAPVRISHNCKQIIVDMQVTPAPTNRNLIIKISYNSVSTDVEYFLAANESSIFYIEEAEASGVVVVTILENSIQLPGGIGATVATCQIDCCIASLVESAITCTCKCDKCKEELDRAEKVFLLLQSAVYAAEVAENIQDAKDKYSKANEMCTEVCACGC